jgi:hypothetical protein
MTVHSDNYVLQEYGITPSQMKAIARRIEKEIAQERRRGTVKPFAGSADALRN